MNRHSQKQTGFTIVELLIVIVVIGILAAITIVAYNGIQNRANDSRRISDLSQISKALEVYYVDNSKYPDVTSGAGATIKACISATGNPSWPCWNGDSDNNRVLPKQYMASIPIDPVRKDVNAGGYPNTYASRLYCYQAKPDLQGYRLGTYLETISTTDSNYFNGTENVGYCNFANYLIRKNY